MSPMFKQAVGMTEIYAKGIAELFLIRCNPYHWDGSGEVPDDVSFDVYKRRIDETYDGQFVTASYGYLKTGKLASKEEYLPLLTELYYVGYKKNELEVCQFARI